MKVAFAQLINDGSEIKMRVLEAKAPQDNMDVEGTPGAFMLELPVQNPRSMSPLSNSSSTSNARGSADQIFVCLNCGR